MNDPTGWKSIPIGGMIIDAGNSDKYKTGSWRTYKPILDKDKCTNCHICWIFCPDSSVIIKNGEMVGFNYDHCKGCGICAEVCPPKVKAITNVLENE